VITVYDATSDPWRANTGSTINPVAPTSYKSYTVKGGVVVLNDSGPGAEMGGGLISADYPNPGPGYFGLDVDWWETNEDLPHVGRRENDLKVTFSGGKQANGSCQWNATKKLWQLDPTGTAWVDTSFTNAPSVGSNTFQLRLQSDGSKWSVLGLSLNNQTFTPPTQFQNLPMISTNWSAGLHPQLQTECQNAPWFLRSIYTRVWVMASANPIPWSV